MDAATTVSRSADLMANWKAAAQRAGLFALFLISGLLVFVFGLDYHSRFWTNTSGAFKIGVSALFLVATVALRRSERGRRYWPMAFAFLAASLANITTWYLYPALHGWLQSLTGAGVDTPLGRMLGKLVDVALRLAPILAALWLVRDDLGSVYVRRGQLKWSVTLGGLALVNLLATSIAVAASRDADLTAVFASLPWWFAFSGANAFMEEIWFRGLFLKRLEPAIGATGAIWLTTLLFGTSHLFATYIEPSGVLVFGVITLTMGFAWGLLMQKTNTLWGSVLFHLAGDVYWLVAFGM